MKEKGRFRKTQEDLEWSKFKEIGETGQLNAMCGPGLLLSMVGGHGLNLIQVWRLGNDTENCYCADVSGCPCFGERLTEVFNTDK